MAASPENGRSSGRSRPVLLDTDIGSDVDDALALALLLALRDELDLVAVTTVTGDTALRSRIASRLLAAAGRPEVEVCAGESLPLAGGSFSWFGHEPRCVVDGLDARELDEPAPERIVRAAREVDGLELVFIGPMTNLARALALDPELPRRVAGLTIMGGHIRQVKIGDFVCAPGIDYNLCSDPAASVRVLGAGFDTTLVTADVTLKTWITKDEVAQMEASGRLGALLAEQVRIWTPVKRAIFEGIGGTMAPDNAAFLHDPLTVLALVEPDCAHFERLRIVPTIEAGTLRTFEVPNGSQMGSPMRVATAIDGLAASRRIAGRIIDFLKR